MLRSLKKSEAGRSLSGGSNHPHILGQPHPGACLTAEAAEILKKTSGIRCNAHELERPVGKRP